MYTGSGIFSRALRGDSEELPENGVSRFMDRVLRDSTSESTARPARGGNNLGLIASTMRGNARVQSQAIAKRELQRVSDITSRMKTTFNADGTVDVKGAPEEFFRGESMVGDAAAAAQAPIDAVERALGNAPEQASTVPPAAVVRPDEVDALDRMYQINDKLAGRRLPRPYEVEELLSTPEGIRDLTLLLGGTPRDAESNIRSIGQGANRQQYAANLTQHLIKLHSGLYQRAKSSIDDAQQDARTRLEEQKETRRTLQAFVKENVAELGTEDDAVEAARSDIEARGLPWRDALAVEVRKAYRGEKRVLQKATYQTINQRVTNLRDEDVRGYGADVERFLADQEADLGPMTGPLAGTRERLRQRFIGLTEEIAIQRKREDRAVQNFQRRMDKASETRPVSIAGWQAADMTVEALVQTIGDPLVDQTSARTAVNTRIGKVERQHAEDIERQGAIIQEHSAIRGRIGELQAKADDYGERRRPIPPGLQNEIDELTKKAISLQADSRQINLRGARFEAELEVLRRAANSTRSAPTVVKGKNGVLSNAGGKLVYRPRQQ